MASYDMLARTIKRESCESGGEMSIAMEAFNQRAAKGCRQCESKVRLEEKEDNEL